MSKSSNLQSSVTWAAFLLGDRSLESTSHLWSCPVLPVFLNHCLKDCKSLLDSVKDHKASKAEETKKLEVSMTGLCTVTRSMGAIKRCTHNELNGAAVVWS